MRALWKYLYCLALCFSAELFAADESVSVHLKVYKISTQANGKELRTPAGEAKPGDVLEYQAEYHNQSASLVRNVEATLPIPPNSNYILPVGMPRALQASTDGQNFASVPLKRLVTLPDGKQELQLVPAEEYRALRWALGDMKPGAIIHLSSRVKINDLEESTAAGKSAGRNVQVAQ